MAMPTLDESKQYSEITVDDNNFKFETIYKGILSIFTSKISAENDELRMAFFMWIDYLWKKEIGVESITEVDVTIKYGKTVPVEVADILDEYIPDIVENETKVEVFRLWVRDYFLP